MVMWAMTLDTFTLSLPEGKKKVAKQHINGSHSVNPMNLIGDYSNVDTFRTVKTITEH